MLSETWEATELSHVNSCLELEKIARQCDLGKNAGKLLYGSRTVMIK